MGASSRVRGQKGKKKKKKRKKILGASLISLAKPWLQLCSAYKMTEWLNELLVDFTTPIHVQSATRLRKIRNELI
jgi:hypothetical protein